MTDEEDKVNGIKTTPYPGGLLPAGLSIPETRAQYKDLIFADTNSTGTHLSSVMFYLAKHPEALERLGGEMARKKE